MTAPTPIAGIRADLISALIGDAPAANDGLIKSLADSVRDRREHQHNAEDLYCDNLAGWAGDRTASVLRRLLDTEAEVTRLRAELEQARAERDRLLAFADWTARNTYPLTEIHTAALTAIDSPTTRAALADLAQVAAEVAAASADAPVPPWLVTHTGAPADAVPARPVRQAGCDTDQVN